MIQQDLIILFLDKDNSMILPSSIKSLNVDELSSEFNSNKRVIINDFLSEDASDFMLDFLKEDMEEIWWFTSILAGSEPIYLNRVKDINKIEAAEIKAVEYFSNNKPSFSFDTTIKHKDACSCDLCLFARLLNDKNCLDNFSSIVSTKLTKVTDYFARRYNQIQFKSPYNSKNNKIGFIYFLTKDWKPEWGGNIFLTEKEQVKEVIVPSFNNLFLYDASSIESMFISQVSAGVRDSFYFIEGFIE